MTTTPMSENELVFSALNLFPNSPRGKRPDWQELEDFRARTLSPERSAEVLSHVANDPDCFQQWLDLGEASLWVDAEESANARTPARTAPAASAAAPAKPASDDAVGSLGRWLRSLFALPAPVYAGAMAAVLVAVLVVPVLQRPDAMDLGAGVDRTLDTYRALPDTAAVKAPIRRSTRRMDGVLESLPLASVERMHFEQGLQASLGELLDSPSTGWRDWSGSLHAEPVDCAASVDAKACEAVAEPARALGQWTLITWFACRQPVMVDSGSFWDEQLDLYQAFRRTAVLRNSATFAEALSAARPDDAVSLCQAVESLMSVSR